jgi:hypothetical protein
LYEFAGYSIEPDGVRKRVREARFLPGEDGPDIGGVADVVVEEGSELRGEGIKGVSGGRG